MNKEKELLKRVRKLKIIMSKLDAMIEELQTVFESIEETCSDNG